MTKLKPILIAIAVVLVAGGVYFAVDSYFVSSAKPIDPLASGKNPQMTVALPFSARDLNGALLEPSQFKDKVLIVNFWASWCGPCVEEFPSLLKLIEAYKEKVVLLAISGDNDEAAIHSFLKNYKLEGLPIRVAWDYDGSIAKLYQTYKLPESYIFKRENIFYRKIEGVKNWHSPAFIKTFEGLVQD